MLRVFVADDSTLIRERLTELLNELDDLELVGEASDGYEAVRSIQKLKPDVAILDIRMPSGSGLQVLETIKQDTTSPVVIVLTAFPYPQYRTKCRELGADYFFDKATELDQVIEVLQTIRDHNTLPADSVSQHWAS